ncbi:hypothetical protein [Frankia sp. QA3]|uniref:hypothetical protein n=1 Tax=Frankia sp. QA3 TaxID=710111 RepID=UPI000269B663|nr:hypothetical protein [Frankia sp. QA3]EIV90794.1 hypothetical protein FraQA3DRAFT_0197 [Frankia sp. QA3]
MTPTGELVAVGREDARRAPVERISEKAPAIRRGAEKKVKAVTAGLLTAAAAAAALAVALLFWRRRSAPAGSPLSALVLDALQHDWSRRVGTSADDVREAVLRGAPTAASDRLRALVGDVEVDFTFDEGASPVHVVARCAYTDGNTITATLERPWENVPQEIRAEYLRSGEKKIHRRWRPPQ